VAYHQIRREQRRDVQSQGVLSSCTQDPVVADGDTHQESSLSSSTPCSGPALQRKGLAERVTVPREGVAAAEWHKLRTYPSWPAGAEREREASQQRATPGCTGSLPWPGPASVCWAVPTLSLESSAALVDCVVSFCREQNLCSLRVRGSARDTEGFLQFCGKPNTAVGAAHCGDSAFVWWGPPTSLF
jgi:hypothetical protein